MVYKCCVPRCRGNYDRGSKVAVFSFPRVDHLRSKWVQAIHREDFKLTQNSKVCELHFNEEDILRNSEWYDSKTGKKYCMSLEKPRLRQEAVPSIFPNCPAYLSSASTSRESGDDRRERLENRDLQAAIAESLETQAHYEQKRRFVNFGEFLQCLDGVELPSDWSVVKSESAATFLLIETKDVPTLLCSAVVHKDLSMALYMAKNPVTKLGNKIFPITINDVNSFTDTIESLENFSRMNNEDTLQDHLLFISDYLLSISKIVDESKVHNIKFLCEQFRLLGVHKNHNTYSTDFIILCSILFSISPHAYRFLRSSHYLVLPHPNTLHKICSNYKTSPAVEQMDDSFLLYIKQKFKFLSESDKVISLMVDEIHLKPYLDYTGGNILGAAYNSKNAAASAQVFMVQSLLSSYKDVAHILPVRNINGEGLFTFIKKIVIGLQSLGFQVICVVTDNNALNRRAMSFFASPPRLSIVYKHPCDGTQPLFYVLDSVHILKCIRNNWLNQKDVDQTVMYPSFDHFPENKELSVAKFSSVKKLYDVESTQIVKYANKLNSKSLFPTNLERQNVKLVLNVFNEMTVQGLLTLGEDHSIDSFQTTAEFIRLICTWWSIVNVSSPGRDVRFKDIMQKPLTNPDYENFKFLEHFLAWLDFWKQLPKHGGAFSSETHLAVSHSTHALLELTKYCTQKLNFKYLLPGKIQTDALEARFGKYRTMAGSQYLISLRQVFEVETKIRVQTLMSLKITSSAFGEVDIDLDALEYDCEVDTFMPTTPTPEYNMNFSEDQLLSVQDYLPVLTYVAGYCARAVLKKLKCEMCKMSVVLDKTLSVTQDDSNYELIRKVDRGGLYCPSPDIINAVIFTYLVVKTLVSERYESSFMKSPSQRNLVIELSVDAVKKEDIFLLEISCKQDGHSNDKILYYIVKAACNVFLNNYVKKQNDVHNRMNAKRRKLLTMK